MLHLARFGYTLFELACGTCVGRLHCLLHAVMSACKAAPHVATTSAQCLAAWGFLAALPPCPCAALGMLRPLLLKPNACALAPMRARRRIQAACSIENLPCTTEADCCPGNPDAAEPFLMCARKTATGPGTCEQVRALVCKEGTAQRVVATLAVQCRARCCEVDRPPQGLLWQLIASPAL